ncbi:MAG: AI-2E family transporter [Gammaproteobacteria bacterium]|nr:MAG: AI-2E family transporter [Gammaproteobacteria bacterium]
MEVVWIWLRKKFGDPQIMGLMVFLLLIAGVIWAFGNMLLPVLASVVFAYLLEGFVVKLEKKGVPRLLSVVIVFSVFMLLMILVIAGMTPLLATQTSELGRELPENLHQIIINAEEMISKFLAKYPQFYGAEQAESASDANAVAQTISQEMGLSEKIFSSDELKEAIKGLLSFFSIESLVAVTTVLVYLVIIPIMIFFFLKDKKLILVWCSNKFMPKDHRLINQIWVEVDAQIGNYIRGKFIEVLIVGAATYVSYVFLGVKFAMLLGVLVGLSVIIPYVGAALVTFPVLILGYAQFGWTTDFAYVVIAYAIIQAIDGNVVVPLLFSEVVNIHPIAIIVAILIFGGLWGFWGVFFAIPLATFVQAVMNAWPKASEIVASHDSC